MTKVIIIVAFILGIILIFDATKLYAEGQTYSGAKLNEAAVVPSSAFGASASSPAVTESQRGRDNTFSLEKIIIGLGLCGVITLAVSRWGSSSPSKNRSKGESASESPSS